MNLKAFILYVCVYRNYTIKSVNIKFGADVKRIVWFTSEK